MRCADHLLVRGTRKAAVTSRLLRLRRRLTVDAPWRTSTLRRLAAEPCCGTHRSSSAGDTRMESAKAGVQMIEGLATEATIRCFMIGLGPSRFFRKTIMFLPQLPELRVAWSTPVLRPAVLAYPESSHCLKSSVTDYAFDSLLNRSLDRWDGSRQQIEMSCAACIAEGQ